LLGTLAWSAQFSKLILKKDVYGHLRMIAGINIFCFEYSLKPGETFKTPDLFIPILKKGKVKPAAICTTGHVNTTRILDG
jgi:hypothetical protein